MLRIEIESYFCCSTGGIILKSRSFQQFCFRFLPSFSNTHFDYSRVFSSVCSNVAWDFLFVFQLFCWHKKRNMDIFSYTWMFPLWIRSNHATYNVFYTEIRQHQHKYPTPQCAKQKKQEQEREEREQEQKRERELEQEKSNKKCTIFVFGRKSLYTYFFLLLLPCTWKKDEIKFTLHLICSFSLEWVLWLSYIWRVYVYINHSLTHIVGINAVWGHILSTAAIKSCLKFCMHCTHECNAFYFHI